MLFYQEHPVQSIVEYYSDYFRSQGSYAIHLNYIEKVKLFLGSKFFYGTYEFRIFSFNKNDNFFCVDTIIDIKNSNWMTDTFAMFLVW